MSGARGGRHAGLLYYHEDAGFNAAPNDTTAKTFGANATLDTKEGSHNAVRVFNPQSREAADIIEQNFSGSFTISFELTNPWFLTEVISAPTTSGSAAPYTHTFDGPDPSSMQVVTPTEGVGETGIGGCVVASCSISNDVPGNPQVNLNGAYASEEITNDGATNTAQPTLNERALTHRQATLQVAGSAQRRIQSVTVDIENNTDLIDELGATEPVDYSPKKREPSIDYTDIVEDTSEQKRFYGDSAATTVQDTIENDVEVRLKWDNGKTGADKNSFELVLGGSFPDSYSRSGVGDAEADLEGELNEMVATVYAIAENSESAAL